MNQDSRRELQARENRGQTTVSPVFEQGKPRRSGNRGLSPEFVSPVFARTSSCTLIALAAAVVAAPLFIGVANGSPITLEAVAVTGQPAPGTGDSFRGFRRKMPLDNIGTATFTGYLTNLTGPQPSYVYEQGALRLINQSRASVSFSGIDGDVFFGGAITPSDVVGSTQVYDGSAFTLLTHKGQYIPELDANIAGTHGEHPIVGQTMTQALSLSGPNVTAANDAAIIITDGQSVRVLWRESDPSPVPQTVFSTIASYSQVTHDASANGNIALVANIVGEGVVDTNNQGVFKYEDGELKTVLRTGDTDSVTGLTFESFGRIDTNNRGDILLLADTTVGGGTRYDAIFLIADDQAKLIARQGAPAPGTEGYFSNFSRYGGLELSNSGKIWFGARLYGPGISTGNRDALYVVDNDELRLLVREGDPAPGTSAIFGDTPWGLTNDNGQFLLNHNIVGLDVTDSNNRGYFLLTDDEIELIVREGDLLEIEGSMRTLSYIDFPDFSNAGLSFYATFTDGSAAMMLGRFASTPSPPVAALLGIGILGWYLLVTVRTKVPKGAEKGPSSIIGGSK